MEQNEHNMLQMAHFLQVQKPLVSLLLGFDDSVIYLKACANGESRRKSPVDSGKTTNM